MSPSGGGGGGGGVVCVVVSVVMLVVVVAAGGWGWKAARGDSGFDGFVHVNESHVVGACRVGN